MPKEVNQNTDYSSTLNLPKTDFAMKAGLVKKEPAFLEKWEKEGLYASIREQSKDQTPFVLHDGPPYANGNIHIGHALNKILKDIIVKYKTMQGYDALYLPGWDCHGLPIEHQLLKELKISKTEVDPVEFRRKAHDYAMKYVEIQKEEFKRLGIMGEWEHPYLTLNTEYEYWILKSLSSLHSKGYIYRGLKPVNWCFSCETALAEAEVEYEDHNSKTVFVKFKVNNSEQLKLKDKKPVSLVIWTTTPWTLMANVAVSVHEHFKYAVVDIGPEYLIIEESLSGSVLGKGNLTGTPERTFKGSELTGLVYTQPFHLLENCRVVTAEYVTKEDGTGLVHTAPGHGQEDFETGLKHNLDVLMPVSDKGLYTDRAAQYVGEHVFKANDKIIEQFKSEGSLVAEELLEHPYPHCWRCKKPIIFRATHQWFLNVDHDQLRGKLREEIQKVNWIPEGGEARISTMIEGRPDWCLSRQRCWGVPIPAIKYKGEEAEPKLYAEVIDHFSEIVKTEGTNAWFEKDIEALIPKGFKCPETGKSEFEKTYDILDVWFDSGVSHQAVVKAIMHKDLPIDMYLEGSDQHRGWFQSSLIPAVCMEGRAPYKNVLTHGFVVDGQGRKMSKSLGNVISPQDIMQHNGADILRLWVASSSYHDDVRVSKEILDRLIDAYRKIRNTFRYLLGNLHEFDPKTQLTAYENLLEVDQWALHRLKKNVDQIKDDFEQYKFAHAYKGLYTFCNEELSSFYLDILKDRLYTSASYSPERQSAQTVLYHILNCLLRVMAPIFSFSAEEIFLAAPKDEETQNVNSVHLLKWLDCPDGWSNDALEEKFQKLVTLKPEAMKALEARRREGLIGSSLEAKMTIQTSSKSEYTYLMDNQDILPDIFIVSEVEVQNTNSRNFVISKAAGQKCSRCWKYKKDVSNNSQHPTLCARCADIVNG